MSHQISARSTGTTRSSDYSTTRLLVVCGAIAGPLLIAVGFIQIPIRAGFDWTRHPLSMLSLGDLGWIQVTNFIVSGLLYVAAAVGLRRALRGQAAGTWGPMLIGGVGIGLVLGGVFSADPGLGFPPGAQAGPPSSMSWHAGLHLTGFVVGFISLVAFSFVLARRFWNLAQRGWAAYCIASGVFAALGFPIVMSGLTGGNLVPLWAALVVGWLLPTVVLIPLLRGEDFR